MSAAAQPASTMSAGDHLYNLIEKRVLIVDELPRNAIGKVQKAELRTRYRQLFKP